MLILDYLHLDYLIDRLNDVKRFAKSHINGEFASHGRENNDRDLPAD